MLGRQELEDSTSIFRGNSKERRRLWNQKGTSQCRIDGWRLGSTDGAAGRERGCRVDQPGLQALDWDHLGQVHIPRASCRISAGHWMSPSRNLWAHVWNDNRQLTVPIGDEMRFSMKQSLNKVMPLFKKSQDMGCWWSPQTGFKMILVLLNIDSPSLHLLSFLNSKMETNIMYLNVL